jgi:hypothetical protein
MSGTSNSPESEHCKMAARRILRIVKKDGSTVDLNIVRAQRLPANSTGAIRVEQITGNDVSLAFNEEIVGPFIDIDYIKVVRENDE